nr:uncharacterized protein LOC110069994 [Pogona vitticeps]
MGACIPKQLPSTPLSVDSLLMVQKSLESGNREADEMARACLDHALREFPREPRQLQDNATLTVQVKGRERMVFVSGTGENKIAVSWLKRKTYYSVEIPNLDMYLDRLSLSPPPLTSENLQKVRQELMKWDEATKELCACLDVALLETEKEPSSVMDDAQLTIQCGGSCLDFISGKGRSHIYILYTERQPRYRVRVPCVDVYFDRLSCRPMPLTTENLLKMWKEIENLKGCTVDLRACLKRAMQEFNALSPQRRANATVFIDCDGKNFKIVSGHGESWISIFNIVGDQHCRREVVLALGDRPSSSRATRSLGGRSGKEGTSFRVRRSEGKRGAEEGPSNQARRMSNRPPELSDEKSSKRWPPDVVELKVFTSDGRKEEEETTSFGGRTLSGGRKTDTGPSSSSKAMGKEHPFGLKVSTKRRKMSGETGMEIDGPVDLPSGTATEEVYFSGKSEEMPKGEEPAHAAQDDDEESPDFPEVSSSNPQGNTGPER